MGSRKKETDEEKALRERLEELRITKTRGPERGFAPDFPNPGPVSPTPVAPRREGE
jgi:hypothetical protein